MTDQIVVTTLRAERGAKYDETGQCISSYNRSIVFLPRSVKPDESVRVRLIQIDGKVDKNGRPMYRTEYAPADLTMECKQAIAAEAQELRRGQVWPLEQGKAILRTQGVAGVPGFNWYYFCGSQVFGSAFPPAALVALEVLPHASGAGLIELVAWVAENGYYSATQEQNQQRAPEVAESALVELNQRASRQERLLSVEIH